MTNKLKKKWLRLYEVAQQIDVLKPWEDFSESDNFAYIWKDKSKTVFFSFICESAGKRGIACYIGEEDYLRARIRLTSRNYRKEPLFMLQNALICLWDDRQNVSKENYAIIKELGFKPRGKGAWLHFEHYEIGYVPVPFNEKDIDLLTTEFENLHMMLRAIYERGVDPEFDKGNALVRWYEPKDKLYYTYPIEVDIPEEVITRPVVTIRENDMTRKVRAMPTADYSVELDWSYVGIVYDDDDGRETLPLLLLAVEPKNGIILVNEMLSPSHDRPDMAFYAFDCLIKQYGKPSEIVICDEDLKGILADVCKKVGIKLTVKKRLPAVKNAKMTVVEQIW